MFNDHRGCNVKSVRKYIFNASWLEDLKIIDPDELELAKLCRSYRLGKGK